MTRRRRRFLKLRCTLDRVDEAVLSATPLAVLNLRAGDDESKPAAPSIKWFI